MILPRSISLPFMFISLVLIFLFLCMLCYFHIWFACNKKYRKKYQAKQQGGQQDQLETGLSGLHSTVDGKIFEVQHDGTRKQVAEFNDFSLIWRHLYSSAGAYYMAVTFLWKKKETAEILKQNTNVSHGIAYLVDRVKTNVRNWNLFVSTIFCYFHFNRMHIEPANRRQNVVYRYNYIFSALQCSSELSANKCYCVFIVFEIVVLRF